MWPLEKQKTLVKRKKRRGPYKAITDKKVKCSFTLSKGSAHFIDRIADLQGLNPSDALDRFIWTIRLQDQNELVYLMKQKKLELEDLVHQSKRIAIMREQEDGECQTNLASVKHIP
ncbi:hypothetical protein LCGC14_1047440 [marine sediment metagenome]|uniref:Uncharacterized protein n=1 Tax=marine sediment metagenome TaxID=412755 RepID=A0A0F9MUC3_9ZZZZ